MSSGLNATNPIVVAAFKAALLHQGLVVLALLVVLFVAWRALRILELRRASAGSGSAEAAVTASATSFSPATAVLPEAAGRRVLRIGFGLLWILDGLLQAQAAMPLGLGPDVIQPAVSGSPVWFQHLVNGAVTVWTFHPIEAAAAAVWIQMGIGILLLVAPRGRWSRLAGAASVGWGLCVWVFGEALGGILAPGGSFLFGAPGAVLFYAFAGAALALPERAWVGPRLGRVYLGLMGVFFLAMAVLQALPGQGFWVGRLAHGRQSDGTRLGAISDMAHQMATTPQPHFLSSWLTAFGGFDVTHGFAVNLFVVVALGLLGLCFLSGRPLLVKTALGAAVPFCLAVWVLVQDLGVLGGVGTDPNSMVPILLVLVGAERALDAPLLARVPEGAPDRATPLAPAVPRRFRERASGWASWLGVRPAYALRAISALAAIGVVLIGAVPMAVASMNPNASPIIAQATDGTPDSVNFPAPSFHLVDQADQPVSLASLHGKTVAITFLDPVCTSACPVIAQELRQADAMLSPAERRRVELVAVDANPRYLSPAYLVAFDRQERLNQLRNWQYLTGSAAELRNVWNAYGVQVEYSPGGAMVAHSEITYVIDAHGHTRWALDTNTGPETTASKSSFAVTLAGDLRSTLVSA